MGKYRCNHLVSSIVIFTVRNVGPGLTHHTTRVLTKPQEILTSVHKLRLNWTSVVARFSYLWVLVGGRKRLLRTVRPGNTTSSHRKGHTTILYEGTESECIIGVYPFLGPTSYGGPTLWFESCWTSISGLSAHTQKKEVTVFIRRSRRYRRVPNHRSTKEEGRVSAERSRRTSYHVTFLVS